MTATAGASSLGTVTNSNFVFEKLDNGCRIANWTLLFQKKPILNSEEFSKWETMLGIPKLPEMLFGSNWLELHHTPTGLIYAFRTEDALRAVRAKADLQVSHTQHWMKKNKAQIEQFNKTLLKDFDWTYTTTYKGTIDTSKLVVANNHTNPYFGVPLPTTERIDVNRLKRQEPIYLIDEIILYEDELADNGISQLTVKFRVMPTYWFVLLRFWLRVDHVVFRIYDTRLFHDYSSKHILREYTTREEPYKTLEKMLMKDPKVTTDSNLIAPLLPIKSQVTECISLSLDLPPNNVAVPSISPLTSLSEAKDTTPAASNIEQLITNNVSTLKL